MVSYLMRQALLDALAAGPPYQVQEHHIDAMSKLQVLTELERRGLITSDPVLPVLRPALPRQNGLPKVPKPMGLDNWPRVLVKKPW